MNEHAFSRTELLIGKDCLDKLKDSTVIVFGIGGVGSFAVEALARAGVGNLILVDNDLVSITNLNRQIMATLDTIGKPKVQVMKNRINSINPKCNVFAYETFIKKDNIENIIPKDIDYVIDAIDTVSSKISLIVWCKSNNIPIISCMGTGNKLDPTKFKIEDIYNTQVCPLAKVMRRELRKNGIKNLKVLYSEEVPIKPILKVDNSYNSDNQFTNKGKSQVPASISFVPPVAGMIIASEVIKELTQIK